MALENSACTFDMRKLIANSLVSIHDVKEQNITTAASSSDYDLNDRPGDTKELQPAAVLVPLVEHDDGFTLLFTQRTDHLHHHAGQISFPGGRSEVGDSSPVATALRETYEEIGLESSHIEATGYLDIYETVTGFAVTPVVGFVRPGFKLILDEFEVAETFEAPLDFFLDRGNCQIESRTVAGQTRRFYLFEYGDRYIWGATAGMLVNLARRIRKMC